MILVFILTLALLAWLIMQELDRWQRNAVVSSGRCDGCDEKVNEDWLVCPRCRQLLQSHCPACGLAHQRRDSFCPGCGETVGENL